MNDYKSEIEALEAVLALAVRYNASRVVVAGIEVNLDPKPAAPAASSDKEPTLPPSAAERCRCGHEYSEHSEAGCLHGCSLAACAPAED